MEDFKLISYIKKQLDPDSKLEVEAWIKESPKNREYFEKLEEIWEETGKIPELKSPDVESAWEHFDDIITKKHTRIRYNFVIKIAATILVLVSLSLFLKLYFFSGKSEQFTTICSDNSIRAIILPDNTKIWLNKNSKITYSSLYNLRKRKIELEGEAFFDVIHNTKIPFEISTQMTTIRDIGTTFDVSSDKTSKSVKVAVVSGTVGISVNTSEDELPVQANQVALISTNNTIVVKSMKVINDNAWLTEKLIFRNMTLSEIAGIISTVYHTKITFSQKELEEIRITASFDHQPLKEIIEVIGKTSNIRFKTCGNEICFFK